MGGDSGPAAMIAGADRARRRDHSLEFIVYGDEAQVEAELDQHPQLKPHVTVIHSAEAIERTMGRLSDTSRAKVLGLNAARLFGFDVPSSTA